VLYGAFKENYGKIGNASKGKGSWIAKKNSEKK
jgi:hypothetical protein